MNINFVVECPNALGLPVPPLKLIEFFILQVLELDWRPLIRDSFFYAMSIACFIAFAWDGYFKWYEASILLALYALYIVIMVFNPKLMDWMGTWKCW